MFIIICAYPLISLLMGWVEIGKQKLSEKIIILEIRLVITLTNVHFDQWQSCSKITNKNTIKPAGCKENHAVLQPAIRARCRWHVLAHKSLQLAPKPFLIGQIDNNPSVIWISPKNSTCPSGKLRTKNTSPIAKSTSPRLSDTTFFAHWACHLERIKKEHLYTHVCLILRKLVHLIRHQNDADYIVSDDGNKLIQTMVNDNCDEINDT